MARRRPDVASRLWQQAARFLCEEEQRSVRGMGSLGWGEFVGGFDFTPNGTKARGVVCLGCGTRLLPGTFAIWVDDQTASGCSFGATRRWVHLQPCIEERTQ